MKNIKNIRGSWMDLKWVANYDINKNDYENTNRDKFEQLSSYFFNGLQFNWNVCLSYEGVTFSIKQYIKRSLENFFLLGFKAKVNLNKLKYQWYFTI